MVVYQLKMKKQSQTFIKKNIQVNLRSEFSFNVPSCKFFCSHQILNNKLLKFYISLIQIVNKLVFLALWSIKLHFFLSGVYHLL